MKFIKDCLLIFSLCHSFNVFSVNHREVSFSVGKSLIQEIDSTNATLTFCVQGFDPTDIIKLSMKDETHYKRTELVWKKSNQEDAPLESPNSWQISFPWPQKTSRILMTIEYDFTNLSTELKAQGIRVALSGWKEDEESLPGRGYPGTGVMGLVGLGEKTERGGLSAYNYQGFKNLTINFLDTRGPLVIHWFKEQQQKNDEPSSSFCLFCRALCCCTMSREGHVDLDD